MSRVEKPTLLDPTGQNHELNDDQTIIGRAVGCDIVITSKRVSREHTRIHYDDWRIFVEDMGSTNGTFLNEERISEPMQLRDGDKIKVGDVIFTFHDPDVTNQDTAVPVLEVDVAAGTVRVNRQLISLAPKEFDLLAYLYHNSGKVCSKDDISHVVWPEYGSGEVFDYQIENLVRRLRAKLEPNSNDPQLVVTVRGRGYKLLHAL
jgi:DNA-binding winged helix-turn-helix (wHTH) protein